MHTCARVPATAKTRAATVTTTTTTRNNNNHNYYTLLRATTHYYHYYLYYHYHNDEHNYDEDDDDLLLLLRLLVLRNLLLLLLLVVLLLLPLLFPVFTTILGSRNRGKDCVRVQATQDRQTNAKSQTIAYKQHNNHSRRKRFSFEHCRIVDSGVACGTVCGHIGETGNTACEPDVECLIAQFRMTRIPRTRARDLLASELGPSVEQPRAVL